MKTCHVAMIVTLLAGLAAGLQATQAAPLGEDGQTWLAALDDAAAKEPAAAGPAAAAPADPAKEAGAPPAKDCKGAPLPFHCIEGYSGGAITPMAYLCNYCNCCGGSEHMRAPAVSYSYMNISTKHLHTFAVTQTFWNRVELGYAMNQLWLGSLYDDIRKMGLNPVRRDVIMHNFNVRGKLLEENSFGLPLPAVTAGVHFKYNYGIEDINRRVGNAFDTIGYDKNYGVDYTLTATKMFPTLAFGRPVIVTGGLRFSKASQLGLMGFGDTYRPSLEGSVVCLPTDWLVLGYEFRQKRNPYGKIPGLIGDEDNWHALSASLIVNKHLTISALAGLCGNVANANADTTWGLQVKYEF
jgi:hypothetical protein